ncbi:hypothetical protein N7535_005025 [Penicillium sp. DV-2018c]|nr:hypothetical protein N7461_008606 [Penicillium sp. DV-2018c]KAJ5571365.1 hypothetical protein N7535_005025 [Penicillium sp. DV-2018c]
MATDNWAVAWHWPRSWLLANPISVPTGEQLGNRKHGKVAIGKYQPSQLTSRNSNWPTGEWRVNWRVACQLASKHGNWKERQLASKHGNWKEWQLPSSSATDTS